MLSLAVLLYYGRVTTKLYYLNPAQIKMTRYFISFSSANYFVEICNVDKWLKFLRCINTEEREENNRKKNRESLSISQFCYS